MNLEHSALLRARLLAALGLVGVSALNTTAIGQDSGVPDEVCLSWTASEDCPSGEDALARISDEIDESCQIVNYADEALYDAESEQCCYAVVVACPGDTGFKSLDGCCYGRPYMAEGQARMAAVQPGAAWMHRSSPAPRIAGMDAALRQALAEKWARDGQAEHSSIAGFHRFALELMAHGAPPELIERAQLAAMQETEHARLCFALASAYAGAPLGPGPLPIGRSASIAESLVALAVATAEEGAIGEALAAHGAAVALMRAQIRRCDTCCHAVVKEEGAHAELAWATLRWAVEQGGEPVREALREVFARLSAEVSVSPDPEGLQAHGVLGLAERQAARRECVERVLMPCAAQLLGEAPERSLHA